MKTMNLDETHVNFLPRLLPYESLKLIEKLTKNLELTLL